jgi:hypothetical protein
MGGDNFLTAYFPVTSLGLSLVSCVSCYYMMRVVQWMRLAISKGLNTVDPPPPPQSPKDRNRSSFQNVVFSSIQKSGWWVKSRNSIILSVIHHHQNPLDLLIKYTVSEGMSSILTLYDDGKASISSYWWCRSCLVLAILLCSSNCEYVRPGSWFRRTQSQIMFPILSIFHPE